MHRKNSNVFFINLLFILPLILSLLLLSCETFQNQTKKAKILTMEQQIKKAVINAEKKSENTDTWPTVDKIVIAGDYSLAKYKYKSKTISQILLKKNKDKWIKLFGGDSIGFNVIVKNKVPPDIAKELLTKLKAQ
jgi:hypothetical protein